MATINMKCKCGAEFYSSWTSTNEDEEMKKWNDTWLHYMKWQDLHSRERCIITGDPMYKNKLPEDWRV